MCSAFPRAVTLAAICLALAAGPVSARELRICADPNNLPFSNENREGFENKIAELLAQELKADVRYTWWAQRRGFLRNTLNAGLCDVVIGMPSSAEGVRTTAPYYRSSYVFVTRADGPSVASFDDEILRAARVGVQLIGNDGVNTPPAHALSRRGIIANVHGYPLYGDYREPNPPARIIDALAADKIDVALAWGPLAGYFAGRQRVPLRVTVVAPLIDAAGLPMAFDISVAVRRADDALRREIDAALERRRAEIDAVLDRYGVPRLPRDLQPVSMAP